MIDAALFSTLYLTVAIVALEVRTAIKRPGMISVASTRRPIGPDDKFRTSYICAMPPE